MMLANEEKERPWARYAVLAIAVLLFAAGNYYYFVRSVSSNEEVITRYRSPEDPLEKYRNPVIAGFFYPQKGTGFSVGEMSDISKERYPQIIVVPSDGRRDLHDTLKLAYQPLHKYAKKIKRIILLAPAAKTEFSGAALLAGESWEMPEGAIKLDRDTIRQLAKQSGFKYNSRIFQRDNLLKFQLSALQNTAANFVWVPLIYGQANPQDLAEVLRMYLQEDGTLLVVVADLSHYNLADKDEQDSAEATGINTALILAHTMQLHPQMVSLHNLEATVSEKSADFEPEKMPEGKTDLDAEENALRQYAADYGTQLLKIARSGLEEAERNRRKYVPLRDEYDNELFNRGAVFIHLSVDGQIVAGAGSMLPYRAVALDVVNNVYEAATSENFSWEIAAPEQIKISVALLSGYREIEYGTEADLLDKLSPGKDGVVIRDGDRQGMFLPAEWRKFADKNEFWQNLKIKTGMNPGYWSDSIKVYRFRTVEVKE